MKGLEMMLANLLGMKPEEMRAQVDSALHLMKTGASAAEKMQRDIDAIKNHLGIETVSQEVIDNGGRAIANRGNSANGHSVQL
jgi:hypothetical protein